MAKEYSRTSRVAAQIQQELSSIIRLQMKDPRVILITINGVNVSHDLAFADIYVSFVEEKQSIIDESIEVLNGAAGFLRTELSRVMRLRLTPKLRFHYDKSVREGRYMNALIQKAIAAEQSSKNDISD